MDGCDNDNDNCNGCSCIAAFFSQSNRRVMSFCVFINCLIWIEKENIII